MSFVFLILKMLLKKLHLRTKIPERNVPFSMKWFYRKLFWIDIFLLEIQPFVFLGLKFGIRISKNYYQWKHFLRIGGDGLFEESTVSVTQWNLAHFFNDCCILLHLVDLSTKKQSKHFKNIVHLLDKYLYFSLDLILQRTGLLKQSSDLSILFHDI